MPRIQASLHKLPLQDRLALHTSRLKEEALALQPGPERDAMMRRARQAETGSLESGPPPILSISAKARMKRCRVRRTQLKRKL